MLVLYYGLSCRNHLKRARGRGRKKGGGAAAPLLQLSPEAQEEQSRRIPHWKYGEEYRSGIWKEERLPWRKEGGPHFPANLWLRNCALFPLPVPSDRSRDRSFKTHNMEDAERKTVAN